MAPAKRHSPTPPTGLEGVTVSSGDETFVVLSFPIGTTEAPTKLTASETAVVALALGGMRTKAIAAARGVSERTAANQLQSAYRKLGVSSRAELALRLR
jgi:DNA-binding NarL/FixJ family response regulator